MKNSLQTITVSVIFIVYGLTLKGQTTILAEDFSGFNVGTHATPSTSDVSASLDTRTSVPGWTGSLIYPAGGEIKVGTSSTTGWIQTPSVDLSFADGQFILKFDIARWPGDATTVQVYLDGAELCDIITPGDSYESIQVSGINGTSASAIKIEAKTKRFYLDNFIIEQDGVPTLTGYSFTVDSLPQLYPNPATDMVCIRNLSDSQYVEFFDLSGKSIRRINTGLVNELEIETGSFDSGLYIVIVHYKNSARQLKFIKK